MCERRPDIHYHILHVTEGLILSHLDWRISRIADEEAVKVGFEKAFQGAYAAYQRYIKYLFVDFDSEDLDDGEYPNANDAPLSLDSEDYDDDEYSNADDTPLAMYHYWHRGRH